MRAIHAVISPPCDQRPVAELLAERDGLLPGAIGGALVASVAHQAAPQRIRYSDARTLVIVTNHHDEHVPRRVRDLIELEVDLGAPIDLDDLSDLTGSLGGLPAGGITIQAS